MTRPTPFLWAIKLITVTWKNELRVVIIISINTDFSACYKINKTCQHNFHSLKLFKAFFLHFQHGKMIKAQTEA